MDTSLFKRMGVHGARVENEHLYGMPAHWKTESGKDNTKGHSDKTCVKHGTVKDKPNRPYYARGGHVSLADAMESGRNMMKAPKKNIVRKDYSAENKKVFDAGGVSHMSGGGFAKLPERLGGPGSCLSKEAQEFHKNRHHYDQNGRQLDSKGGNVGRKKAGAGGSIFRDSMVDPNMARLFGRKRVNKKAKAEAAAAMPQEDAGMAKGGKACRKKLAVGAVAKIRKGQY